jgi:trehalose synthase-fused probable maltokinase
MAGAGNQNQRSRRNIRREPPAADPTQLLGLLPGRRWFGSKDRALSSVEVVDEAVLDNGPPPLIATILSLAFEDGEEELYNVPLLVGASGSVRDGFEEAARLASLGTLLAHGTTLRGRAGNFRFAGPGLDPMSPPGSKSIRVVTAEQSNSSVVFDDAVILKLFRRLEVGPNPDLELSRFLTNEGFDGIPTHLGEIRYESDRELDLGIAQEYIPRGLGGWHEVQVHVNALYDAALPLTKARAIMEATQDLASDILEQLERLGELTAELHIVLAREGLDPEIGAEPIDSSDLKEWTERARDSFDLVRRADAAALSGLEDDIDEIIDALVSIREPGAKTRIHGDYHLGQVMLGERGWLILDLEGEPARALQERRAKRSPLQDVAGMLRSFSYASIAALFDRGHPTSKEWGRLEPWAQAWEDLARERFLRAYVRTSHEGAFLPGDQESIAAMLGFFEVDKALYELNYERGHRPGWMRIPQAGIRQAIDRRRS